MTRLPHTQGKKIQYFYVHFKRFTFSYTIYKVKKFSVQNLMCTELVNAYSHGCTITHICLKLEYYKHFFFYFMFSLGTHILIPIFLKCELQRE